MLFTIKEHNPNCQYINETRQGYKVVRLFVDMTDDRIHAIVYRQTDKSFILALGYNTAEGYWSQGIYDLEFDECVGYLYQFYNPHEIPFI